MAVNINVKPEESKSLHLKRVEFNNLALHLSKHVPFAKSRAISKLNRAIKLLKRKEAKDGDQGKKFHCKAERLIEQIELLKKFRKLDIAKLLFLIRRSARVVQNDKKSCIQEEALSCVTDYEHINSTLKPHRDRYPNLVEDAFRHLKVMGLKYRRDRISKMKSSSKVQKVLAQEHLLLVTAHQLMGCERELALLNITEDDLMKPSLLEVDEKSEQLPGLHEVEAPSFCSEQKGKIKQFSKTNSPHVSISKTKMEDPTSDAPRKNRKISLKGSTMGGKPKEKRSRVKVDEAPAVKEASTPRITFKQIGSAKVMRLFNLEALKEGLDLSSS